MTLLQSDRIKLRALEPEDIDFLFSIENNEDFWEISSTQTPFSKYILKNYISNSHQDIFEAKQYRFVICNNDNLPIGLIDLFNFEPQHSRVGCGVLLVPKYQGQGFASEALKIIINYSFIKLNVHQIFANIASDNKKSIKLFESLNFKIVGIKKDWIFINGVYKNEIMYQLINE